MGIQLSDMPSESLNVVVTGGSAGIGAAMVRVFADAGHRVLFTYLTGLKQAEKHVNTWRTVTKSQLDQGDVRSIAQFSGVVNEWAGDRGVDVLVNNAALGSATVDRYVHRAATNGLPNHDSGVRELRENGVSGSATRMLQRAAHDEALVRVNALGPLWVTEALTDALQRAARRGRSVVVFIGSVGGGSAAVFPEYRASDAMSKAALMHLSKHLAAEHVQDNIDVFSVSPGATETEMFRQSTLSKVSDVQGFVNSMPKRRLLQPGDVARSVCWLATESPPGIFHGAVLDASMGLAVRPGLQTESNGKR